MTILSTNPEHDSPGQQFLFPNELNILLEVLKHIKLAISDYSAELDFYYGSESRWTDAGRQRMNTLNRWVEDLNVCEDKVDEMIYHFEQHGEVRYPSAGILRKLSTHGITLKNII